MRLLKEGIFTATFESNTQPKITLLDPKRPRKIGETVWSERGISLPLVRKIREARRPWIILILSPIAGVLGAIVWHMV